MNNLATDVAEIFLDAQALVLHNIREGWAKLRSREKQIVARRDKYQYDLNYRAKILASNAKSKIKNKEKNAARQKEYRKSEAFRSRCK
jgi:hypothetical protein